MPYKQDRKFTNAVHDNLAMKIIYPKLHWVIQPLNPKLCKNIDMHNAVDYMAVDSKTQSIRTIQERFREYKYRNYTDFTIRYKRPENPDPGRRQSEFFKLDADYFVYGIINASKENVDEATDFVKYAVVDLEKVLGLIESGQIVVDANLQSYRCQRDGNRMLCPVIRNKDHSSTFVPIDIAILSRIAPDAIVLQKGFY